MVRIRRIRALSGAKILGLLYAALGLLIGALVTLVWLVGSLIGLVAADTMAQRAGGFVALLMALISLVVFPILYGGIGFILGLVAAAIYNLIAGWVGGIELELEEV